jgi:hypothetical protein
MAGSGHDITRRRVLTGLGATGTSLVAARALAQADDPLQQLIQQNQNSQVGQGFDSASRTSAASRRATASRPTGGRARSPSRR